MTDKPPMIEYEPRPRPASRTWGMSRPMWWLLAGFCAVIELSSGFAMHGRPSSTGDSVVQLVLGAVGILALINAIRMVRQAK